jgi:hypothetical protein
VFLFGDHIGFRGCRENRKIMRRPGLRLAAGALPLNQAILERDLMRLAKTPAKLEEIHLQGSGIPAKPADLCDLRRS